MSLPKNQNSYTPLLPRNSSDLIDALNEAYPLRCINPNETLEAANRYAGARDVVEFLLEWRRLETDDQCS